MNVEKACSHRGLKKVREEPEGQSFSPCTGRINLSWESKGAALATTEVPLSKALIPQLLQWATDQAVALLDSLQM